METEGDLWYNGVNFSYPGGNGMELGEKLLLARQEAGLSQRQLCEGIVTRNMLSQIEHGTARPSMDTLRQFAQRLEKPVSYFLEEEAALSPNQGLMARVRSLHAQGQSGDAWLLLKAFRQPDPLLEWEWKYLSALTALDAAEKAMAEEKDLYARQLLEELGQSGIPELERRRLLLLGRAPRMDLAEIVKQLPSLDEELLLRAEAALAEGKPDRAAALLDAAEDRDTPHWNLLYGRMLMGQRQYPEAAEVLQKAEEARPESCLPLLEICYRESGNFQKAYEYACKQRK